TMHNKWGDYQYPASDEWIGPQASRMKYRAEPTSADARPRWEDVELDDDDDWQQVACTFGPYWQVLDPIAARLDSVELQQQIIAGADGQANSIELEGAKLNWQPYEFSWKLGADRVDVHQHGTDGLGPVSPNFMVLDAARNGQPIVRYLTTRVFSPREQMLYFDFGSLGKLPSRQAWVNGELILDIKGKSLPALSSVTLRSGWNQVVLRLVQMGRRPLATFALFHSQPKTPVLPRFMPLSRWHQTSHDLTYDCRPAGQASVGWYRFLAPPGAQEAKLNLVAESVEAWVNGEAVEVVDDTIQFFKSPQGATQVKHIALRVHQKPGNYEGAAFQAPISFKCARGQIPLGDWCQYGLDYYSGGIRYVRRIQLSDVGQSHEVSLDLGDVRTSAEVKINGRSLGVRLARPFVFDLSEAIQPGDNEIEVEVLNTLANYMSAGHSKYVFESQTVSGLLGPVTLRMVPRVRVECRPVREVQQRTGGGTR
ncbi:MAG: glycosylhydrolase-like jelly roll fold domain-containing protein, partial [Pirellulales bacterium]